MRFVNLSLFIFFLILIFFNFNSFGQDLLGESIRKIGDKMTSVYMDKGIFHKAGPKKPGNLKAIRHSYSPKQGMERIVFDFAEAESPRIYGHFSTQQKKISLDLFNTDLAQSIASFGSSHFVEGVNFLSVSKDSLSVELHLRPQVTMDVFSLSSPGRLVIDLRSSH